MGTHFQEQRTLTLYGETVAAMAPSMVIGRGSACQLIMNLLRVYPEGLTRQEISRKTKLTINNVCGRVGDLRRAGYIAVLGRRADPYTNNKNEVLVVVK